jgi:hypothetical protein
MTPQTLKEKIEGTNNGYLFAPTAEECKVARANPDKFIVIGQPEIPFKGKILNR